MRRRVDLSVKTDSVAHWNHRLGSSIVGGFDLPARGSIKSEDKACQRHQRNETMYRRDGIPLTAFKQPGQLLHPISPCPSRPGRSEQAVAFASLDSAQATLSLLAQLALIAGLAP